MRKVCLVFGFLFAVAGTVHAQDPVTVDPAHYKVEFENANVRVLRITYGPGEESVMHEHPAAVALMLTDADIQMTYPDGTKKVLSVKKGEAIWDPATKHLPKNLGSETMKVLLVELKHAHDEHPTAK